METNTSDANPIPLASAFSAYARNQLGASASLAGELSALTGAPLDTAGLEELIGAGGADPGAALRRARRLALLSVMERDLAGTADLAEVTGTMSDLADIAIRRALAEVTANLAPRYGTPYGEETDRAQTLHVVGMGKLGGRELNVSSDIDLIFLYPEEGETRGGQVSVSNQEYFGQVGKRLIALISDMTADGYVFRVDMRLRPWGDGPLAMGFPAFENYLVVHGRDWERYAWIKGRVITGDRADELAAIVTPFVFRRYLDFGAIESLKSLHAQIEREVARRDLDDHVKLGPGGIREIEFIAQAMQIIRGGRDTALRVRPTIPVLEALGERGLIAPEAVTELRVAYDYLRRVEHRLQYAEDQQTHVLPRDDAARERLARSMGEPDWKAFEARLDGHRRAVRERFSGALGDPDADPATSGGGSPDWQKRITAHGFPEADELVRLIEATRGGAKVRHLAESTRARFDALLPRLIEAAAATPTPGTTAKRLLTFIESIASRASYLALLTQSGAALKRLASLCGASEWAARYLTLHPILLDELIDSATLFAPPDMTGFSRRGGEGLAARRGDLEAQMIFLREEHHTAVFRLLAQDVENQWTVERLADQLTELADRTLQMALDETWATAKQRHRDAPEFIVVAYGKLGGKELGYASDLDLVFIHDDTDERAGEIYGRLAQRLVAFLDTQTTAGRLFEVDTRLRPDGASGLLVTSLAAYRDYQEKRAWVWEHQALTRARFCAGSARIGQAFEEERAHILTLDRDREALFAEVRAMRRKMHDGHPNRSTLFDLKHDSGGMVDIEFCVQALVLAHARTHRQLIGNLGNIALLGLAADAGLVAPEIAHGAADAYRAYRKRQHAERLNNSEYARAPREEFAAQIDVVKRLWREVLGLPA